MNLFEQLRNFYHVAKDGSIKKASASLNASSGRVGRYINELENELNEKLFYRKKNGLELTPLGIELFKKIQTSVVSMENVVKNFYKVKNISNSIKIVTTNGVVTIMLARAITQFLMDNKDVDIKIHTSNEDIDFFMSKFDVGILPKILGQNHLNQRKIIHFHSKLFASQDYLIKYGYPKNIEDLDKHQLISFYPDLPANRGNADWHLQRGKNTIYRRARLAMDSVPAQFEAVKKGLGIFAVAEECPYIKEFNLVPVLPNEESVKFEGYFITRAEEYPSKLVEKLFSYLKNYFE